MLLCFKQKGKHKVPANFSSGNQNQEKIKDGQKHKLSSQITIKKTKRKKKELICDSSEEDSDCDKNKEQVPEDVEKEKINENPPHLVFILPPWSSTICFFNADSSSYPQSQLTSGHCQLKALNCLTW